MQRDHAQQMDEVRRQGGEGAVANLRKAHEKEVNRLNRTLEEAQTHADTIARQAQTKQEEMKHAFEGEIGGQRANAEREIQKLKDDHEGRLAGLRDQHQAELQQAGKGDLAALKRTHRERIDRLQQEHHSELETKTRRMGRLQGAFDESVQRHEELARGRQAEMEGVMNDLGNLENQLTGQRTITDEQRTKINQLRRELEELGHPRGRRGDDPTTPAYRGGARVRPFPGPHVDPHPHPGPDPDARGGHGEMLAALRDEIRNRGRHIEDAMDDLRTEVRRRPPPGPPGDPPPGAPTGVYKSRIPPPNITTIKVGGEQPFKEKIADLFEKKAKQQRTRVLKKRGDTLTNLRKKYMDARREANSNLRKEKANRLAQVKKDVGRLPKGKKAAARKVKQLDIKKMWKLFKNKYPHWKHIKTVAQLRKLTETVKTHRLNL
jgi:archaellum component FlaC